MSKSKSVKEAEKRPPKKISLWSPWGKIDDVVSVAPGIDFVSTASHGGFRLSRALANQMPQQYLEWSCTGMARWWEEDDCVWYVVATFPDLFPADEVAEALKHIESPGL